LVFVTLGSIKGIANTAATLHKLGYSVTLVFMDTPKGVAMDRAVTRFKKDGRAVQRGAYDLDVHAIYRGVKENGYVDETQAIRWDHAAQEWQIAEEAPGLSQFSSVLKGRLDDRARGRSD
jgi:hypothetical protein